MHRSFGNLSIHRLFSTTDMGIRNPEPHVELVIREFLKIGEAVAPRQIVMPKGILLLQMAPDNPDSGAIYVYDRSSEAFYMLCFEDPDETLTVEEFCRLLNQYDLLQYAAQPELLQAGCQITGSA